MTQEMMYRFIKLNIFVIYIFLGIVLLPGTVKAMRDIPDDNLAYPVLVTADDGTMASGFYVNHLKRLYFVTAKHVLFREPVDSYEKLTNVPIGLKFPESLSNRIYYDGNRGLLIFRGVMSNKDKEELLKISSDPLFEKAIRELFLKAQWIMKSKNVGLLSYPKDINGVGKNILKLDVEKLHDKGMIKMHNSQDVVSIFIGKTEKEGDAIIFFDGISLISHTKSGIIGVDTSKTIKLFSEVLVGNEVFIFGYPTSLGIKEIKQIQHDKPLLRKGSVAGKNSEYKNVIIDCPTYPGNSGGPVIEKEQIEIGKWNYRLIGLISEFVPFEEMWISKRFGLENKQWQNSGYSIVVPVDAIMELLTE
ncbi:MAG: hypothetical protein ACHQ2F_06230 [Desulfobaccales bacterium]